tara:strand:- start:881 stop:1207 length:327 start_codon:yes stop_codon:yes gene_type:complete
MSAFTELIKSNNTGIFIISKDDCILCENLKKLFDTINIIYVVYKYSEKTDLNLSFKTDMKIKTKGIKFPFCFFNGKYVGGYNELYQNLMTGKLQDQLNEIGLEYEEDF